MKRLAQIAALIVVALLSACNNKEVVRDTDRDHFMGAAEAKAWGLVDEVL